LPHPELQNSTPFIATPLFLADEENKPLLTMVVRGTFSIAAGGPLRVAEVQKPLEISGIPATAEASASYLYEPETAFTKLTTDIALIGSAHAPNSTTTMLDVGLKVGRVQKIVRAFGDRYWVKTGAQVFGTRPQPFQKLPLTYERSFGGWDRANKDETKWSCEPRNPVGRGFGDPLRYVEEGKVPMPNFEDPNHLISRYGEAPPPAGFGFTSPHWHPRAKFAGTYDAAWEKERKPLLPKDFDRRFFNAASTGLVAPSYLKGDEDVVIVNASATTPLQFKLPGIPPPVVRVFLRGGHKEVLRTKLDTVIFDTDQLVVILLWRIYTLLPNGPHDVTAMDVMLDYGSHNSAVA
jgi:hypothetical protein